MSLAFAFALCLPGQPLAADHRLEAPPGRRDPGVYHSAPDSLRLDADAGEAYYRFPEVPVRGGTVYRLRLRYLLARGTPGGCVARLGFYHDTKSTWKGVGSAEYPLAAAGRWGKLDVLVRVPAEANSAALDVRLDADGDLGEAWVDSVSLAPRGEPITRGP